MTFEQMVDSRVAMQLAEVEKRFEKRLSELKGIRKKSVLIRREKAAEILGCAPTYISFYVKRKRLTPVGEGRPYLFDKEEVESLKKALDK